MPENIGKSGYKGQWARIPEIKELKYSRMTKDHPVWVNRIIYRIFSFFRKEEKKTSRIHPPLRIPASWKNHSSLEEKFIQVLTSLNNIEQDLRVLKSVGPILKLDIAKLEKKKARLEKIKGIIERSQPAYTEYEEITRHLLGNLPSNPEKLIAMLGRNKSFIDYSEKELSSLGSLFFLLSKLEMLQTMQPIYSVDTRFSSQQKTLIRMFLIKIETRKQDLPKIYSILYKVHRLLPQDRLYELVQAKKANIEAMWKTQFQDKESDLFKFFWEGVVEGIKEERAQCESKGYDGMNLVISPLFYRDQIARPNLRWIDGKKTLPSEEQKDSVAKKNIREAAQEFSQLQKKYGQEWSPWIFSMMTQTVFTALNPVLGSFLQIIAISHQDLSSYSILDGDKIEPTQKTGWVVQPVMGKTGEIEKVIFTYLIDYQITSSHESIPSPIVLDTFKFDLQITLSKDLAGDFIVSNPKYNLDSHRDAVRDLPENWEPEMPAEQPEWTKGEWKLTGSSAQDASTPKQKKRYDLDSCYNLGIQSTPYWKKYGQYKP